jgi:hypothetical protein
MTLRTLFEKGGTEMAGSSKYRHELKYHCGEIQLNAIQNRLRPIMSLDRHAEDGQYTIRSMYFDSYDNRCYFENESGTDPREKFRIRIYNANNSRISLECKRKERGKTLKTSCLITEKQYEEIMCGGSISNLREQPEVMRKFSILMKTQGFAPAVIVEYERIPFVYTIGNVRITLDRNIRSSKDFDSFFQPNIQTRPILPAGQHLLEVKYDELLPDHIKSVLQLGNLQQTTFSKFYLCKRFSF